MPNKPYRWTGSNIKSYAYEIIRVALKLFSYWLIYRYTITTSIVVLQSSLTFDNIHIKYDNSFHNYNTLLLSVV